MEPITETALVHWANQEVLRAMAMNTRKRWEMSLARLEGVHDLVCATLRDPESTVADILEHHMNTAIWAAVDDKYRQSLYDNYVKGHGDVSI